MAKTKSFVVPEYVDVQKDAEKLAEQWRKAKDAERAATQKRLIVESKMIDLIGHTLPDKGTTHVGPIKIVTGINQAWDQETLNTLREGWRYDSALWPFKTEFKAVAASVNLVRENYGEAWETLEDALTETPKKPAFFVD